jgi:hypothetical protein
VAVSHALEFTSRVAYDSGRSGITLEVWLRLADLRVPATAKLDTGASLCGFRRELGDPHLVSADGELNAAASAEGFAVSDPNVQP